MAIYHLRAKIISRSKGQSTVAGAAYRSGGHSATHAAAYRSGEKLTDQRTGRTFDYGRKQGIVHTKIIAPKNAPAWAYDRSSLWNRVEARRKAQRRSARPGNRNFPASRTLPRTTGRARADLRQRTVRETWAWWRILPCIARRPRMAKTSHTPTLCLPCAL